MINKVSFEGIGEVAATFRVDDKVTAGMPVKLDPTGKAVACSAGDRFVGVALTAAKDGCATVQVGGFVTAAVTGGEVNCGVVNLVADGTGGVKKATGSEGSNCLVAAVEGGKVAFMM